jgi:hypothetical protein
MLIIMSVVMHCVHCWIVLDMLTYQVSVKLKALIKYVTSIKSWFKVYVILLGFV